MFEFLKRDKPAQPTQSPTYSMNNQLADIQYAWQQLHAINTQLTSAVDRIATDAASVQVKRVRAQENKKDDVHDYLWDLLNYRANKYETAKFFWNKVFQEVIFKGISYVWKKPTKMGTYEFVRVAQVTTTNGEDYSITFYYGTTPQGTDFLTTQPIKVTSDQLLIIRNPNMTSVRAMATYAQTVSKAIADISTALEQNFSVRGFFEIGTDFSIGKENDFLSKVIDGAIKEAQEKNGYAPLPRGVTFNQVSSNYEPVDKDNLLFLVKQIYNAMGLTEEIINGSATDAQFVNYYNQIVLPVVENFIEELTTKTFTVREIGHGNQYAYSRMKFLATPSTLLTNIGNLVNASVMMLSEAREVMGLEYVEGTDIFRTTKMTDEFNGTPYDTNVSQLEPEPEVEEEPNEDGED